MKKYPKIRYPSHEDAEGLLDTGTEVVVQEKVDGANFRFTLDDDGSLLWGTRNTIQPKEIEESNKQFRHVIRYLYETIDFNELREWCDGHDFVFFGESMHKHSIDYDAWDGSHPPIDDDVPNVVIFDIYDESADVWVPQTLVGDICYTVGLRPAPWVYAGPAEDLDEDMLWEHQSDFREPDPDADTEFDRKAMPEGFVIKNQDNGVMAKLVHDEFKEKNAIAFDDPSKAQSDGGRFVSTYVTEARIRKIAHKLIDEGDYDFLEMEMMRDLPRAVLEDVMAEEGWTILTEGPDMETFDDDTRGAIRSKTSSKCARILKEEINSL